MIDFTVKSDGFHSKTDGFTCLGLEVAADLLLEVPDLMEEIAADLRGLRVVAVSRIRPLAC